MRVDRSENALRITGTSAERKAWDVVMKGLRVLSLRADRNLAPDAREVRLLLEDFAKEIEWGGRAKKSP